MPTLYTVAVYAPGDSKNRVLIPDLECTPGQQLHDSARGYAHAALQALAKTDPARWVTSIVSTTEVQDVEGYL